VDATAQNMAARNELKKMGLMMKRRIMVFMRFTFGGDIKLQPQSPKFILFIKTR
jgi:hypothetical protein